MLYTRNIHTVAIQDQNEYCLDVVWGDRGSKSLSLLCKHNKKDILICNQEPQSAGLFLAQVFCSKLQHSCQVTCHQVQIFHANDEGNFIENRWKLAAERMLGPFLTIEYSHNYKFCSTH